MQSYYDLDSVWFLYNEVRNLSKSVLSRIENLKTDRSTYGHVISDKDSTAEWWTKFVFLIIDSGSIRYLFFGEMKLDSYRAYKQIKSKIIAHLRVDVNGKTQVLEDNVEFFHDFGVRFLDTRALILKQKWIRDCVHPKTLLE